MFILDLALRLRELNNFAVLNAVLAVIYESASEVMYKELHDVIF